MADFGRFLSQTSINVQTNAVDISDLSGLVDQINVALEDTDNNVNILNDNIQPINAKFTNNYNNFNITNISGQTISGQKIYGNEIYLNGIKLSPSGSNVDISNNTVNALITVDGSNNTLFANPQLTFDSSNDLLTVDGSITLTGNINTTGSISGTSLYINGVNISGGNSITISGNTQYGVLTSDGTSNTLYSNSGLLYNPSGLLSVSGNIYSSGNINVSGNLNSNSLSVINNIGCNTLTGANGFSLDTCGNLHTNLTYSTSSISNDQSGNIITNGSIVVGRNICMTPSGNLYGGNFVLPTYVSGQLPSGTPSGTIVLYSDGQTPTNYCLAVNPSGVNWLYTPKLSSTAFNTVAPTS
jgi:hypothetical protein